MAREFHTVDNKVTPRMKFAVNVSSVAYVYLLRQAGFYRKFLLHDKVATVNCLMICSLLGTDCVCPKIKEAMDYACRENMFIREHLDTYRLA